MLYMIVLSSCIVDMVYVVRVVNTVRVVNIMDSLYSTLLAPQSQTRLRSLEVYIYPRNYVSLENM